MHGGLYAGVVWVCRDHRQIKYSESVISMCVHGGLAFRQYPPISAHHHDSLLLHNKETTMCTEWFGRQDRVENFGRMCCRWCFPARNVRRLLPFLSCWKEPEAKENCILEAEWFQLLGEAGFGGQPCLFLWWQPGGTVTNVLLSLRRAKAAIGGNSRAGKKLREEMSPHVHFFQSHRHAKQLYLVTVYFYLPGE